MSTHGRSGLGRFVVGSVAEQVLHQAPIPVVTIQAYSGLASNEPALASGCWLMQPVA
jgi:hypothetical protein